MANRDYMASGEVTKDSLIAGIAKRCEAVLGEDFVGFSYIRQLTVLDLWQLARATGFNPKTVPWLVSGQLAVRKREIARSKERMAAAAQQRAAETDPGDGGESQA